jgi:type III pantothenate kinase
VNVDVVVDAGNTFVKWGRCSDEAVVEVVSLNPSDTEAWNDQITKWVLKKKCQWVVAGSDPSRRNRLVTWLGEQYRHVRTLNSHFQLPITVNVKHSEKVGLDRLCNGIAINKRKPQDMAAVVIDAGTAVTVDYVDEAGVFQGGAILPGLWIMAELLHWHTAALPLIKSNDLKQLIASSTPPGKSTLEAMALGAIACFHGGIERVAREYVKMAGERVVCYIGGGDGTMLPADFPLGRQHEHHHWPEMTLEGIRIAGEQLPA